MKEPGDQELYERMRRGDRGAVAMLYDRYEEPIFRYGLHMSGSRSTAEDVVQEVFMHLMSGDGFDPKRGPLEAYLYGIARNRIRMARRVRPAEPLTDCPGSGDVLGGLIHCESIARLRRLLLELPERYRDAVVLCDLEERSYEDAAALMGCPIGTVRSRLYRGRALLAAKMRPLAAVNGAGR